MTDLYFLLAVGAVVGAASSYLGSFMVLKRMSLVGDALSHVALPGIAIALTFGINPMLGAILALAAATVGIWYMGEHSSVYPEALVGVFFTASLALGLLLTPEPELLEALFGDLDKITAGDGLFAVAGAALVFAVTYFISKKLLLGVVSEDLAKSQGINVSKINLVYLLMVGLVVALGVQFLGTLLTGAMVIIPAATAKNLSGSTKQFQLYSVILGVVSSALGIFVAGITGSASGPVIVLVSVFFFILSFAFKK
jgi:ABC-type Mn2+/Zn2+ transport system permease subunit